MRDSLTSIDRQTYLKTDEKTEREIDKQTYIQTDKNFFNKILPFQILLLPGPARFSDKTSAIPNQDQEAAHTQRLSLGLCSQTRVGIDSPS